ncbi:Uncharacterised protein [Xylophilus ampelinus]|nr:hypothetical protein [Variovorax sp.]VTY39338.1 Uncharacterised protein [Xylophilus ampelinus]
MKGWGWLIVVVGALLQGCGGGGDSSNGIEAVGTGKAAISGQGGDAAGAAVAVKSDAVSEEMTFEKDVVIEQVQTKPLQKQFRTVNLLLNDIKATGVDVELFQGNMMPSLNVVASLGGDFGLLQADPFGLKAIVEAPAEFYSGLPAVGWTTAPPNPRMSVLMSNSVVVRAAPGVYSGHLRLSVCLPSGCAIGAPYPIPYRIKVLRGTQVSQDAVVLRSRFGEPPSPVEVVVTPPEGWPAAYMLSASVSGPWNGVSATIQDIGNGTAKVRIAAQADTPVGTTAVSVNVPVGARSVSDYAAPGASIQVQRIVEPNTDLLYLATPPEPVRTLMVPAQTRPEQFRDTSFVVQAGLSNERLTFLGVEFFPSAALQTALPQEARADLIRVPQDAPQTPIHPYYLQQRAQWSSCGYDAQRALHCLPVGRYPFQLRYMHQSATGLQTPFQLYGELVVSP